MEEKDINALADLLDEAAAAHHPFEASHTPHQWKDYYATYIIARQNGESQSEAIAIANRRMRRVFNVRFGALGVPKAND